MIPYLGDFAEDATVHIPFNTFSSDDPAASVTITDLVAADIKVHKDGSVTEIVTDGATIAIDFDGITGNHLITIDTSAHGDYAIGSDYIVRIEGTTVDAGTVNAFVGQFSIENRFNEVDAVKIGGQTASASGTVTFPNATLASTTNITAGTIATVTTNTDMRGTDSAALASEVTSARMATLTDWIDGGRLDLLLDAIPTTAMRGTDSAALASVATEARLAELDAGNLPTDIAAIPTTAMRGTDSAALASVATEARLAELDAGNLPTDIAAIPTTAMRGTDSAALASEVTSARMATLTDWIDGGRLDLLLDAIPTTAMRGTDSAATATEIAAAKENIDYALTVLVGALSTAGTAGEVYTFTVDGVAYTVTYAGLDSSGNRGTTVLSKV